MSQLILRLFCSYAYEEENYFLVMLNTFAAYKYNFCLQIYNSLYTYFKNQMYTNLSESLKMYISW